MPDAKLFAGHRIKRLRRQSGLTQAAMAEMLEISPSYLNLVERNQRPLSATLLLKLAEKFDFDTRSLADDEPGGGEEGLRRRLADPMFADLEIDRDDFESNTWILSFGKCSAHRKKSELAICRRSRDRPPERAA